MSGSPNPALRAYCAWIERHGLAVNTREYDLFAAGYRARVAEEGDTDARVYEAGRRRGLAECPCGTNPGAADLLEPAP